ncbi:hypothetical protein D043_3846A, partial [Vibrio parahaemolyticus EKP-021]
MIKSIKLHIKKSRFYL